MSLIHYALRASGLNPFTLPNKGIRTEYARVAKKKYYLPCRQAGDFFSLVVADRHLRALAYTARIYYLCSVNGLSPEGRRAPPSNITSNTKRKGVSLSLTSKKAAEKAAEKRINVLLLQAKDRVSCIGGIWCQY